MRKRLFSLLLTLVLALMPLASAEDWFGEEHEHSYYSFVSVEPTCTEAGQEVYECDCGDSYAQPIPARGHAYAAETVPAGCGDDGYTLYTCQNCGQSYKADVVPALGHAFENGVCTRCGKTEAAPEEAEAGPEDAEPKQQSAPEEVRAEPESDESATAEPGSGDESGAEKEFVVKNGILTAYNGRGGVVEIPGNLGIQGIDFYVFRNNLSITEVHIPEGVQFIMDSVFDGCTNLKSVSLPDSLTRVGMYTFRNTGLESITVPPNLNSFDYGCFSGCQNLRSVRIESQRVGGAFSNIWSLEEVYVSEAFETSNRNSFYECKNLKKAVIYAHDIPTGIFANCESLTDLTTSDEITSIGDGAFANCKSLSSIPLMDSVVSIGKRAFYGCSGFSGTLQLPEKILTIDESTFQGCSGIEEIIFPQGLTAIGKNAFFGLTKLKSVEVPAGVTSVESGAFCQCSALEKVRILGGTVGIAFDGCENLKELYVGKGVTFSCIMRGCKSLESLEFYGAFGPYTNNAFEYCESLKQVILGPDLKIIPNYAFRYCRALEQVTLPEGIEQIGDEAFAGTALKGELHIPGGTIGRGIISGAGYLEVLSFGDRVTKVDDSAFAGARGRTLVLSDSIEELGSRAFMNSSFSEIQWGSGLKTIGAYSFSGMSNLTELDLPDSVISIGSGAFQACTGLSTAVLGKNIQSLGNSVFSECSGLESAQVLCGLFGDGIFWRCSRLAEVTLSDGITDIGYSAFGDTALTRLVLPDTVENIGMYAFSGCDDLTEIVLPDGLKSIQFRAFSGCTALKQIVFPESLETIGNEAFTSVRFTELVFPDSLESIGEDSFWLNPDLRRVDFGSGVRSIGSSAFAGCTALEEITFPQSMTEIGASAFGGCESLTAVVLPEQLQTLGNGAFANCTKLQSAALSMNQQVIPDYCFYNCPVLTDISTLDALTRIGIEAFSGCEMLENVTLPDTLREIGDRAFQGCTGIRSLVIPASVVHLGSDVFLDSAAELISDISGYAVEWAYEQKVPITVTGELTLSQASAELNAQTGLTLQLTANSPLVTWESSNPMVARVENGLVTALMGGEADIICRFKPDPTRMAVCKITASSVFDLSKSGPNGSAKVALQDTLQLIGSIAEKNGWTGVAWKSSKPEIAKVTASGEVKPLKEGKTVVTMSGVLGKKKVKASVTVTVFDPKKPYALSFEENSPMAMVTRAEYQLHPVLEPVTSQSEITWKSSKPKIASVSGNGVVTPLSSGKAVITATTVSGKCKATVTVIVKDPYMPIKVYIEEGPTLKLRLGEDWQLGKEVEPSTADSAVTWKSSKPAVVSVDDDGLAKGLKEGTAVITATTKYGKKTAKIKITVYNPYKPTKISLEPDGEMNYYYCGQPVRIYYHLKPSEAYEDTSVVWSVSPKGAARISQTGHLVYITGLKTGTVTVTAKCRDYPKVKASVKVKFK